MSFHLYSGNKLENLARAYVQELYLNGTGTDADIFTPCTVIVQTQGMGAWLRLFIASNAGIAANLDFPFLKGYMENLLRKIFPDFSGSKEILSGEVLVWKIYHLLGKSAWPELEFYLKDDDSGRKRHQLACRIADLFDQYGMYRSEMLGEWRKSPDPSDWQCRMYLELFPEKTSLEDWIGKFERGAFDPSLLPPEPSVALFGISSMPPSILNFYLALSRFRDVHFFYLNPSESYWKDAYSNREIVSISAKTGETHADLRLRNPLLGAFGAQGRGFFDLLQECTERTEIVEHSVFSGFAEENGKTTASALETVQEDVLGNVLRSTEAKTDDERTAFPAAIPNDDDSIRIHNCHGTLRQIEALQDALLDIFSTDPGVEPRDTIVMAPDIQACEPYINAVFGNGPLKDFFVVSDHTLTRENPNIDAFLELLKIGTTPYEFTRVRDLLTAPAMRKKRNLTEDDLTTVEKWCFRSGVRWGLDSEHRKAVTGVSYNDFSWKFGLDRMILGYAVASNAAEQAVNPVIPFDAAEGGSAQILGNFISFVQDLFRLRELVSHERTLAEWSVFLTELTDRFLLSDDDSYQEISALKHCFRRLAEYQNLSGMTEKIPCGVVLECVSSGVVTPGAGSAFLHGKITFCSMVPMRSVPMKVVALLNLNDGEFPRKSVHIGFDRIMRDPKKYDRSRSAEDRYLFLEAILAARKKLLLFYTGHDKRGTNQYPPALPLSEFLDVLRNSFSVPDKFFCRNHKLQAFDPDYFDSSRPLGLQSFSQENFLAAKALEKKLYGNDPPPDVPNFIFPGPETPNPSTGPETVLRTEDFERILIYPAKAYALKKLGLSFERDSAEEDDPDNEPLSLSPLASSTLRQAVAEMTFLNAFSKDMQYEILQKTAVLPASGNGRDVFLDAWHSVENMPEHLRELFRKMKNISINLKLGPFRISGTVQGIPPEEGKNPVQLYSKFSSFNGADAVRWYVRHLLLGMVYPGMNVETRIWNGAENTESFSSFDGNLIPERLNDLAALAAESLERPVPFFPYASFAFVRGQTQNSVSNAFKSDFYRCGDWYYDRAVPFFFQEDILDSEDFMNISKRLLKPYAERETVNAEKNA